MLNYLKIFKLVYELKTILDKIFMWVISILKNIFYKIKKPKKLVLFLEYNTICYSFYDLSWCIMWFIQNNMQVLLILLDILAEGWPTFFKIKDHIAILQFWGTRIDLTYNFKDKALFVIFHVGLDLHVT